jgi:hypothetical protein
VLDAAAFELRRNRGGKIIGLDVVDGSTVKVLLDDTGHGHRPRPTNRSFTGDLGAS